MPYAKHIKNELQNRFDMPHEKIFNFKTEFVFEFEFKFVFNLNLDL